MYFWREIEFAFLNMPDIQVHVWCFLIVFLINRKPFNSNQLEQNDKKITSKVL